MELPLVGRAEQLEAISACLEARQSVVIGGPSGVGRTRLLHEAADLARDRGTPIEWVAGSLTARPLLFGAVPHLVASAGGEPHEQLRASMEALSRRREPPVLLIDDAELLDPASALLVHHVVRDGVAPAVLAVGSAGAPVPDVIVSLWSDLGARRVELVPLTRPQVRELVEAALGGEVGADLEAQVWRLSRGFPLDVREVLVAAAASDTFTVGADGIWRTTGPIEASRRLAELARSSLARLPEDLAEAIEELARVEPVAARAARRVLGSARVEALERRGLVTSDRPEAGEPILRFARPLEGEALRASMTTTRAAARATEWAAAITAGEVGPGDRLQAATLLLAAGERPDPELALAAAREALAGFDGSLAQRLAEVALDGAPERAVPAAIVRGLGLQMQGSLEEADRALDAAVDAARDDVTRTEAALARARNRHWSMGDREGALEILERARDGVEDGSSKGALDAETALFHAVVGALDRAGRAATEALRRGAIDPQAELTALVVLTLALCVQGRLAELSSRLPRALELARTHRGPQPLAEDQIRLSETHTLLFHDLSRTETDARDHAAGPSPIRGLWRATVGLCELATGRVADAVVTFREAVHQLEGQDPFGNLDMVRCMHALASGRTGDHAAVTLVLDAMDRGSAQREPRSRVWLHRARAFERALAGDIGKAAELACRGGEDAVAASHLTWGALALHDAVVFGAAEQVAPLLAELADRTDVDAIGLFADHAAAVGAADADAIERAALRLFEHGRTLDAAEAFAQAADATTDRARRGRALVRAAVLARHTQEAWIVTLAAHDVALSPREAQIAVLAAIGRPNRDIASELFLSHRTVENHLARVYRRFGLDGRDDLREALLPPFVPVP